MSETLLKIKDLHVHFPIRGKLFKKEFLKAVDGVTLTVKRGQTLGLVGESGSGKSTLARTIVGLEKATAGDILYNGESVLAYNKRERHAFRKEVQMIFQDPFTSLHPRMNVGDLIAAPLKAYQYKGNIEKRVKEFMELVGLQPDKHYERFPHEFSGGQRQRIGIARAIILEPKLVICDEPVSALDVSIQAQIINLLQDLQSQLQLSYLFIAHDMSVIKHIADEIAVMYLGKIVEKAENETFFKQAKHPYTKALLHSIPIPDPDQEKLREQSLVRGELPSAVYSPTGCVFHSRCPFAQERCRKETPQLVADDFKEHSFACFYPLEKSASSKE